MSRFTYRSSWFSWVVGLGLLAGACSDGTAGSVTSTSASVSPRPSIDPSGTTGPAEEAPPTDAASADETAARRCTGEGGPGRDRVIRAKGSRLVAAEIGRGPTWAVFLHQTDGGALCGWWTYGAHVAGRGVHVLLLDLCGYGRSVCTKPLSNDQVGQASAAVAFARRHGARRVTVVGASMGGAVALPTARTSRADAVVDLSGPPDWSGANLDRDVGGLTMPTLLAASPDDPSTVSAFREAIRDVPAKVKRLEVVTGGHGYVMLGYPGNWSRLATTVERWILGDYP